MKGLNNETGTPQPRRNEMNRKISLLAPLTVLLVLGLCIVDARAGSSVNYLGKTTWTVTITDDTDAVGNIGETFPLTGGISRVGDEFYLFQGYVTLTDDDPLIMTGSGVMVGNRLLLTLSESQAHKDNVWHDSGVMHVALDRFTLNGTFYDIDHGFNATTRHFGESFTAGTLSRTGTVISLDVNLAPQQLLLLDK
jgi:hypothetical protein